MTSRGPSLLLCGYTIARVQSQGFSSFFLEKSHEALNKKITVNQKSRSNAQNIADMSYVPVPAPRSSLMMNLRIFFLTPLQNLGVFSNHQ